MVAVEVVCAAVAHEEVVVAAAIAVESSQLLKGLAGVRKNQSDWDFDQRGNLALVV